MNIAEATILIVDDEPELLEIFAVWLRRAGCTVLTAINGAEALKLLQIQQVDALVSDIRMPIMDGVTLVRTLFELGIHIPSIIFVSGFGDIDVRDVYALGVEALLAKPLSRQQFMQALEGCLRDRDEMWIKPAQAEITLSVELHYDSLQDARAACTFDIGRGGCCFHTDKALTEERPVQLSIHFSSEDLHLQGQGIVRWYRPKDEHAGVEFTYLEPACRSWVIDAIQGDSRHSFIPHC
jgi:CheY-like chemotaxis protein